MIADNDSDSATQRKALEINLDPTIYGTFAEIGQARRSQTGSWPVGAASGTVAQTISAYDKSFSDERYGQGTRYVSRERLQSMLDREFQSLQGSLRAARAPEVRFFAFADTVAARNFKGDNEQHGWVGVRFEREGSTTPHDVLFHIEFRDQDVAHQREALGILGVNLVHAAFHERLEPEPFLRAAFQGLSSDRLEIDVIEVTGPAFAETDSRLWCLEALRQGSCRGIVLDRTGKPDQPFMLLRKRALVVRNEASLGSRPEDALAVTLRCLRASEARGRSVGD